MAQGTESTGINWLQTHNIQRIVDFFGHVKMEMDGYLAVGAKEESVNYAIRRIAELRGIMPYRGQVGIPACDVLELLEKIILQLQESAAAHAEEIETAKREAIEDAMAELRLNATSTIDAKNEGVKLFG